MFLPLYGYFRGGNASNPVSLAVCPLNTSTWVLYGPERVCEGFIGRGETGTSYQLISHSTEAMRDSHAKRLTLSPA